ncbi:MAG TPA: MFS transporter, partial [Nocardioidaceae bacterium]|nr:MFS transporter [Nocardioidaceae bacterium]
MEASSPSHVRGVCALAGLALSAFTFNTTENLPVGLLDLIARDLATSLSATGTLVAVYGLVVALTSVPLARVAKPVPRRYVLTVVLATLVLSTLVSAMAEHLAVLFSARIATALAQAMFWAVMAPAAVGLFRPEVRGRVVGVMFACGSLATVAGVPAGTWLGHHGDWRTPFIALAVLGLVALLLVGICLP